MGLHIDNINTGIGCLVIIGILAINIAWISVLLWAVIRLVT